MGELERLASSCVLPGFEGTAVPDWIRRRIDEGLGGVVLYAWNVESGKQLRALTDDLCSERDDLVIAIDEEGGDVTRLEAATGSSNERMETGRVQSARGPAQVQPKPPGKPGVRLGPAVQPGVE